MVALYKPVSGTVPQYSVDGNTIAAGYFLKGYTTGTTTPLSMATDEAAGTLLAKCKLNTQGYPLSNDADDTTVFIPYFNVEYKFALYRNATDADNNTTANADWVVDTITVNNDVDGLNYNEGSTGSVDRTQESHNQEFLFATDKMTTAQIADVRAGTLGEDVLLPLQAALDTGKVVILPEGSCLVSAKLSMTIDGGGLIGQGPYQSEIVGNFASGDILHVDGSSASVENIYLADFRIDSTVVKTSGVAFHLQRNPRLSMARLIAGGQDGRNNGDNLFDGFHFDIFDFARLFDFEASTNNDGVIVNGGGSGGDLFLLGGKILDCGAVGLHLAGDVGGFHAEMVTLNKNATANVTIDQSQEAQGNRQIGFGPGCSIDGESIASVRQQPGVVVNDAGLEKLEFTGVAFAVHTFGIDVQVASSTNTVIQINGGRIAKNDDDGIRIQADIRRLMINNVDIHDCTGWGINSTVDLSGHGEGEGPMIQNNSFRNNTLGDVRWANIPPLSGTTFSVTIADDAVFSFTPRDQTTIGSAGLFFITQAASADFAFAFYRAAAAGSLMTLLHSTTIIASTGALTGTTGADGTQTISAHTDKKIYIENRSGGELTYALHLLAAFPGAGGQGN